MNRTLLALALLLTAGSPQAYAQAPTPTASARRLPRAASPPIIPASSTARRLKYAATVGETVIRDKDGVPTASLFTTAYVREG